MPTTTRKQRDIISSRTSQNVRASHQYPQCMPWGFPFLFPVPSPTLSPPLTPLPSSSVSLLPCTCLSFPTPFPPARVTPFSFAAPSSQTGKCPDLSLCLSEWHHVIGLMTSRTNLDNKVTLDPHHCLLLFSTEITEEALPSSSQHGAGVWPQNSSESVQSLGWAILHWAPF